MQAKKCLPFAHKEFISFFARKWRPMLTGMKSLACPGIPGSASWVGDSDAPVFQAAPLFNIDPPCEMNGAGLASNAPAYLFMDCGTSHCFVDSTFAEGNGFARHPSRSLVH